MLLYPIEFYPSTTTIGIRLIKILIVKVQLFSRYLVQYFLRIFNFLERLNKLFIFNFIQIPLYVIPLKKFKYFLISYFNFLTSWQLLDCVQYFKTYIYQAWLFLFHQRLPGINEKINAKKKRVHSQPYYNNTWISFCYFIVDKSYTSTFTK